MNSKMIPLALLLVVLGLASGTSTKLTLPPENYDASAPPPRRANDSGSPLTVHVDFHVLSIERVDHDKKEFELQIFFRQSWQDERLRLDGNEKPDDYLILNNPDLIWTPDLFFVNEKKTRTHDVLKNNAFVRILPDGRVLFSKRLTLIVSCPMSLKAFPFDTQTCSINIESYSAKANELLLKWKSDQPITLAESGGPQPFRLVALDTHQQVMELSSGSYSRIFVNFHFSRICTSYVVTVYIPSVLTVMLASVSYYLDGKDVASRLLVSLAALLLEFFITEGHGSIPNTPYIKAIDVFLGTCICFIFATVLMTATISFYYREKLASLERDNPVIPNGQTNDPPSSKSVLRSILNKIRSDKADKIDGIARILFMPLFGVFCIVYFCCVL